MTKKSLAIGSALFFEQLGQQFIKETAPTKSALFEPVKSIFAAVGPVLPTLIAKGVNIFQLKQRQHK